QARLTQVAWDRWRLCAGEEHVPRIALMAVPTDLILISLVRGRGPAPIWGGIRLEANELMMLGAGQRLHMRTDGPVRWGAIRLPLNDLVHYGRALTGAPLALPSAACHWRSRRIAIGHLRHLHAAAIGLAEGRSRPVIDGAAAHGLEQQLIHAL